MKKHPLRKAEDDSDRRLLADVEKYGCHIIGIEADEQGPQYAFSVGLYHTYDQPEIIIMGISFRIAAELINLIAEQMGAGKSFQDGDVSDSIAEGFPMAFRNVSPANYPDYVGYALWFYESPNFPLLQCIWPDRDQRFPWDEGCEEECRHIQRLPSQ